MLNESMVFVTFCKRRHIKYRQKKRGYLIYIHNDDIKIINSPKNNKILSNL